MADRDARALTDGWGRRIDYVRLSVTDRCDLRCRYCMGEDMVFAPRRDLLTIGELGALADILVDRGIRRIRLTGGEPLGRGGVLDLAARIGRRIGGGLNELTLTTNGTRLAAAAEALAAAGVRRVNVSMDSLDAERFRAITRGGDLATVVAGIDAAESAGIAVKINMVALRGVNDDEFVAMARWCGARRLDLSLIETMPLGETAERREGRYLPLAVARAALEAVFTLSPSRHRTGGPSRYFDVAETGGRIGFITPLSDDFCAGCNRIRVSATGTIYGCLGHDQQVELRDLFRAGGAGAVAEALDRALAAKPARHAFDIAAAAPAVARHMSVTGG